MFRLSFITFTDLATISTLICSSKILFSVSSGQKEMEHLDVLLFCKLNTGRTLSLPPLSAWGFCSVCFFPSCRVTETATTKCAWPWGTGYGPTPGLTSWSGSETSGSVSSTEQRKEMPALSTTSARSALSARSIFSTT